MLSTLAVGLAIALQPESKLSVLPNGVAVYSERLAAQLGFGERALLNIRLACLIHDIGKVEELAVGQGFSYTDAGQLLGHLAMGQEMVGAKIAQVEKTLGSPFPSETRLRLMHMLLSHHGSLEHGSPRLPMTPEAIALHEIAAGKVGVREEVLVKAKKLYEHERELILQRLYDILTAKDETPEFLSISMPDRKAILEILVATKPNLPAYWRVAAN